VLVSTQWAYVAMMAHNCSINVIKLSFLLQYRRVFAEPRTVLICNVGIIFTCIWAVVQISTIATACFPVALIIPTIKTCLPSTPVWLTNASMNIVTDFAIFMIPVPCIMKLNIPNKKQKAVILLIFSIGFL
jgi:hypothetical protein